MSGPFPHEHDPQRLPPDLTKQTPPGPPATPGYPSPGYGTPGYGTPDFGTPGYGPGPTPGMGTPGMGAPGMGPGAAGAALVVIGDITCTQTHVITPSGTFPIAGTQWSVLDMSRTSEEISQTGIILALVGFVLICALSLLFLLMKETKTTGYIQVTVHGHGITHVTNIPALNAGAMFDISNRVQYARSLAAA
ncbi:hypothetical protein [Gordonia desulfuricans]